VTRRSRLSAPRGANFVFSVLIALWTVLALLAAQRTPALTLAALAGGRLERAAASLSGNRETISTCEVRNGEVHTIKRPTKTVDRNRSFRPSDGSFPPFRFALTGFSSVSPSGITAALRPVTWRVWQAPARARALLMVFLN
jgi:hypothetical protein